jgi:tetratricopeptide (TPR) repeat protein
MTLDPYSACPCGSGKKLKFCCSSLAGELDKIWRMLDGDQWAACLQRVTSLLDKEPDQPSLLAIRGMIEMDLERFDAARETVTHFLEIAPDNPVAHAEEANLLALTVGGRAAAGPLQQSIARADNQIPEQLYNAIGAVGASLYLGGDIAAAVAHLKLQAGMAGEEDKQPLDLLLQIQSNATLPLVLRDERTLSRCPDGVTWKEAFDTARQNGLRGRWREAAEQFEALVEPSGDAAEVWRNLALVRCYMADNEGAVDAWRHYASLDVPFDDAVEAESLAQLLDPEASVERDVTVQVEYPIRQLEALEVALSSDKRTVAADPKAAPAEDEDAPPPRTAFRLLSQPVPETGIGLDADGVPETIAYLFIYGKETDRPARLLLVAIRDDRLTKTKEALAAICDEMLDAEGPEEIVSERFRSGPLHSWGYVLPNDTPNKTKETIMKAVNRKMVHDTWAHRPQKALGGRPPAETAKDESLRIKTLAAILLLETAVDYTGPEGLNPLREELGLPVSEPIDPTGLDIFQIPLVRLWRVVPQQIDDEALIVLWRTALVMHLIVPSTALATEIVNRESFESSSHRPAALGMLATVTTDPDERLALLNRAREAAEARGDSSAPWDLRELVVQIQLGEGKEVQRLVTHVDTAHGNEPGVREKLLQILVESGLVQPPGRAAAGPPPGAVPGPPPAKPSGLWTPDQGAAPPATEDQQGEKPAIWTPGMD